jgi:midasin
LVFRFSIQHFTIGKFSPFHKTISDGTPKKKKSKKSNEVSQLEVVESCLRFLKLDLSFFRRAWNWDEFIEVYHHHGCDLQKLYCNQVIALLFGLTTSQLSKMNANIPTHIAVETETKSTVESPVRTNEVIDSRSLEWSFKSNKIAEIEGVFLPIFDELNFQFYADGHEKLDRIIRVDSTKVNLRSLALGISSGKAICLSGPVGSGKTSLVEYLARKTGQIAPRISDFMDFMKLKNQLSTAKSCNKRKLQGTDDSTDGFQQNDSRLSPKNGFLRIQLGDQTDSKILLGQYRCTDVPGEFLWQPGVLTQAVLNGYWLLLEDLDAATQDVCTVLTNLLENNFLSVPGFRENLKIAPGFQLFVTLR